MPPFPKTRTIRLKGEALEALRMFVYRRDGATCQDCGRMLLYDHPWVLHPDRYHLAHIKSRGAGGSDTAENCLAKCSGCHSTKDHGLRWSKRF